MTQETLEKIRRGVKVDTSLHELYWETRREREALGLPPPEHDISDPKKVFAEWHREQGLTPPSARRSRKKASSKKDKRHFREFTILIAPAPEHGYWAYCPAVNGKRLRGETIAEVRKKMTEYLTNHLGKLVAQGKLLPKQSGRIEKVKVSVPLP